jgi:hypothetical protein
MDNMTFFHNAASANGIKLQYVIGGHGDPVVLLHDGQKHGRNSIL